MTHHRNNHPGGDHYATADATVAILREDLETATRARRAVADLALRYRRQRAALARDLYAVEEERDTARAVTLGVALALAVTVATLALS